MGLDEGASVDLEVSCGAVSTALELASVRRGEAFALVDLGGTCRGGVDVPVRALVAPAKDRRTFEGGVVVHEEVDARMGEDGSLNLVEEPPYSGGVMYSPTMSRTFSTYSDSLESLKGSLWRGRSRKAA
jgi:hypothetical protein